MIYVMISKSSAAAGSRNQERDRAIARRLFLVVLTDFLCWFPMGLMGVLAKAGTPIPGTVNVWAAVFVLPLNSALNPFLYTVNGVAERWRAARQEKRRGQTLARVRRELGAWPRASVSQLVRMTLGPRIDAELLSTVMLRAGLAAPERVEPAAPGGASSSKVSSKEEETQEAACEENIPESVTSVATKENSLSAYN